MVEETKAYEKGKLLKRINITIAFGKGCVG